MSLKKCKECGNQVSTKAEACPSCGAKIKKQPKNYGFGTLIVIIIVIGVVWSQIDGCIEEKEKEKETAAQIELAAKKKADLEKKVAKAKAEFVNWRHSGFNVFCGSRIQPGDEKAMENLARYIIRASFSQERMTYIPQESKVIYQSKDGKEENVFDALEWLAAMCSHVPNKGEQIVRYYGYYSNVSRGKRKKVGSDELIPPDTRTGLERSLQKKLGASHPEDL